MNKVMRQPITRHMPARAKISPRASFLNGRDCFETTCHKPCDEKLWVEDNFLWISEDKFSAKNSKYAFEKVFKAISNKLRY